MKVGIAKSLCSGRCCLGKPVCFDNRCREVIVGRYRLFPPRLSSDLHHLGSVAILNVTARS